MLVYAPGTAPRLLVYAPPDYWHTAAPVPELVAGSIIDVRIMPDAKHMRGELATLPIRTALVGPPDSGPAGFEPYAANPADLMHYLDLQRSRKTAWEVDNIRQANSIALAGHAAAARAYAAGGAEYDIHCGIPQRLPGNRCGTALCRDRGHGRAMPPPCTISGSSAHARRPGGKSLLIDAGIAVHGYASDITRTHTADAGFRALIDALDSNSARACARQQSPASIFATLHLEAHRQIAALLHTADIVRVEPEECLARGISRVFFPHGLGHFLGLQVHDAGGRLADTPGESLPAPDERPLPATDTGSEPRECHHDRARHLLYRQPAKCAATRSLTDRPSTGRACVTLRPFGGIRIEDNVLITDHAQRKPDAERRTPGRD